MTRTGSSFRRTNRMMAVNPGRHSFWEKRQRREMFSGRLLLEGLGRTEAKHSLGAPSLDVLRLAGFALISALFPHRAGESPKTDPRS